MRQDVIPAAVKDRTLRVDIGGPTATYSDSSQVLTARSRTNRSFGYATSGIRTIEPEF